MERARDVGHQRAGAPSRLLVGDEWRTLSDAGVQRRLDVVGVWMVDECSRWRRRRIPRGPGEHGSQVDHRRGGISRLTGTSFTPAIAWRRRGDLPWPPQFRVSCGCRSARSSSASGIAQTLSSRRLDRSCSMSWSMAPVLAGCVAIVLAAHLAIRGEPARTVSLRQGNSARGRNFWSTGPGPGVARHAGRNCQRRAPGTAGHADGRRLPTRRARSPCCQRFRLA